MASLNGLHPFVKAQAEKLLENANKRLTSYKMIITQAYRSKEEQDKLYAQGRSKPGKIVTKARGGQSMHNFGLAIDFALVTPDGKRAVWDIKSDFDKDGKADWMEVVEEAKKLGFEWGGDWKSFKDYPHFEMSGGLSLEDLQAGKRPLFKTPVKKAAAVSQGALIPYPGTLLKMGSNGKDVERIQRAAGMPEKAVNGKYDVNTVIAVTKYQAKHGLKQDGKVGPATWNKMF